MAVARQRSRSAALAEFPRPPGLYLLHQSINHKMRTLTIYKFNELSDEAKAKAIEAVREDLKEDGHDQFAFSWAIDDCALFEPAHAEMVKLLGEDYYDQNLTPDGKYGQFVFKNLRKGIEWEEWWVLALIASALEITNDRMFKLWLGIPERLHKYVEYTITDQGTSTILELSHELLSDDPVALALKSIFDSAIQKFATHMITISERIRQGMEDYYSDEEMEEKISEGDWEFDETGDIFFG